MKRPLAYITAAWYGGDTENAELAAQYCRSVYDAGFAPIHSLKLDSFHPLCIGGISAIIALVYFSIFLERELDKHD